MNAYAEVQKFYESYRGTKRVIGRSALGRCIYAVFVGSGGGPVGIAQYSMHAREYITAYLALEHARRGVKRGGAWIVPLVNPDGAELSEKGLQSIASEARRRELVRINFGSEDFSLWKANAQGVDLNVNFPARWGTGEGNVTAPAPHGCIGCRPLSAPESRALAGFTLEVNPSYTVSWHTKGEVIYWRFHQPRARATRDRQLARILSRSTGYPLDEAPLSAGGYKDWCVETLHIPAFTVEAGRDAATHPLAREELPDIVNKNLDALFALSEGF